MMTKSQVEVQLLGPVEMTCNSETLTISRRVERNILYILAVEQTPVSRTALIDMLWPEATQVDPRGTLRTALSRLRRNLPQPDSLITELDYVSLKSDDFVIDVQKFVNFSKSLQATLGSYPSHRPLPAQIVTQIQEALDLWHGEHLLQGKNFGQYPEIEIWRQSHDKRLNQQRELLINRLAEHYQAAGQPELALTRYLQLGLMNPLDIPVHVAILKIYVDLGRVDEAIAYCDYLEDVYEQKLNAPLPDEILKHCQFTENAMQEKENLNNQEWSQPLTMQLDLVGREDELAQLRQAYFGGGIMVIWGAIGVGKTRLVQELFKEFKSRAFFFIAPAQDTESSLPYAPLVHGLRQHISKDVLKGINLGLAYQLWFLIPEIADIRNDMQQDLLVNYRSGNQQLFDALYKLLGHIAAKSGKVIVFLDDAQWVDPQTLSALSYLIGQGFFEKGNLLIIAARPEVPNPELGSLIDQFYRLHPFQAITLNDLNPEELKNLVTQVLHKSPSTNFIAKLYQETTGNPFYSIEIIRVILDLPEGVESLEGIQNLPFPETIYRVIRNRLNQLDKISSLILQCAAVLGNSFPQELLIAITEEDQHAVSKKLDDFIRFGILNVRSEQIPQKSILQFSHEKVREVILKETPPHKLRSIHLTAAEKMVNAPHMHPQALIIAQHYLEGGDFKQAFHWFIEAGVFSWKLGAREDADKAFSQADNLLENVGEAQVSSEDIIKLFIPWNDFAYQTRQPELEEQIGLKLQFLGERKKMPKLLGMSYIMLASSCFLRQRYHMALEFVQKAIKILEQLEDKRALGSAVARHALFNWYLLDFDQALSQALQTLELSKSLDPNEMWVQSNIFNALFLISTSYYAKGNAKQALSQAEECYKNYYHKLITYHKLRTMHILATAHALSGNYQDCVRSIEEGLQISSLSEYPNIEENYLTVRARAMVFQGNFDQAYDDAHKALKMAEEHHHNEMIVSANCILGDIFFTLHNAASALQHYRTAQMRAGLTPNSLEGIENAISLARVMIWLRETEEAKSSIEQCLRLTQDKGMEALHTRARIISGYADIYENAFSSAEKHFKIAGDAAQKLGLKYEVLSSQMGQARLAVARSNFDLAQGLLETIIHQTQQNQLMRLNLVSWTTLVSLSKSQKVPALSNESQEKFHNTLKIIEQHTQSEPLRQNFLDVRRYWESGEGFP
jgi:DNA-binding SARP family transcriptional activator/uncharacterized protein YueI